MKNKYINHSKISEKKFREIIKLFSIDLECTQISKIISINRKTVNNLLNKVRERLVDICNKESYFTSGEIEIDESYFRVKRIKKTKKKEIVVLKQKYLIWRKEEIKYIYTNSR